jgi:hypothetical protein
MVWRSSDLHGSPEILHDGTSCSGDSHQIAVSCGGPNPQRLSVFHRRARRCGSGAAEAADVRRSASGRHLARQLIICRAGLLSHADRAWARSAAD